MAVAIVVCESGRKGEHSAAARKERRPGIVDVLMVFEEKEEFKRRGTQLLPFDPT